MENADFDWGDYALNYEGPELLTFDTPRSAKWRARIPLLRLSGWKSSKQYDKDNPSVFIMTFGRSSPSVRTSELGMFAQIKILISS